MSTYLRYTPLGSKEEIADSDMQLRAGYAILVYNKRVCGFLAACRHQSSECNFSCVYDAPCEVEGKSRRHSVRLLIRRHRYGSTATCLPIYLIIRAGGFLWPWLRNP